MLQWIVPTRPDMAFATKERARALASPTNADMTALRHLVRYYRTTSDLELRIPLLPLTSSPFLRLLPFWSTALYSSSPRNRSTSSSVCKAGALVPSPPCLGEGPHGWVPVDTHSTPVLTSVRRLWVAYVLYEPNEPQEHAQPAHGSGARVQDHDPETSQPAQTTALRPLAQVMVAAEQIPSQSAAQQLSRSPPERTSSDDDESSTPSMEQSEEAAPATPVSKVLKRCWRMPRWSHPR